MSLFDQTDDRDFLAELTGPGGKYDRTKYASEAEMYKAIAKGKVYADEMVNHKNTEFDQLREDYIKVTAENNAKAKIEDYFTRLNNQKTDDTTRTQSITEVKPEFDESKIDSLLEQKLAQREAATKEAANMATVEQTLRQQYGDNASRIIKEKMNALELTPEDMKLLARKSPAAVINALGLNRQASSYNNPPSSTLRSDSFKHEPEIRDALYWEKLRQEKPKEYFTEKNSLQRLKDMANPEFMNRYNERQARSSFQ